MTHQLTLSEAARTLVSANRRGVLSTLRSDDGYPYGSLVDYLPLDDGDAAFFLSTLAEHQRYLTQDPRASLTIAPALAEQDALARPRVTLVGRVEREDDARREVLSEAYLKRHPGAARYIHFKDFAFYRLRVERARYIAGFGRMGWLDADPYHDAQPDLLATMADGVVQHMNEDHAHNLLDYARALAGIEAAASAQMTGVDRYGFDMVVTLDDATSTTTRVPFDTPLTRPGQIRKVMVQLAERARDALGDADSDADTSAEAP